MVGIVRRTLTLSLVEVLDHFRQAADRDLDNALRVGEVLCDEIADVLRDGRCDFDGIPVVLFPSGLPPVDGISDLGEHMF